MTQAEAVNTVPPGNTPWEGRHHHFYSFYQMHNLFLTRRKRHTKQMEKKSSKQLAAWYKYVETIQDGGRTEEALRVKVLKRRHNG